MHFISSILFFASRKILGKLQWRGKEKLTSSLRRYEEWIALKYDAICVISLKVFDVGLLVYSSFFLMIKDCMKNGLL